jgi:hypothetical protein
VGCLTVLFIVILGFLSSNDSLTPGICMVFSFILFTLYLTGVIECGIQLFGSGNVSNNCQTYVFNNKVTGLSVNTLAWLQQNNICKFYLQTIECTLKLIFNRSILVCSFRILAHWHFTVRWHDVFLSSDRERGSRLMFTIHMIS